MDVSESQPSQFDGQNTQEMTSQPQDNLMGHSMSIEMPVAMETDSQLLLPSDQQASHLGLIEGQNQSREAVEMDTSQEQSADTSADLFVAPSCTTDAFTKHR